MEISIPSLLRIKPNALQKIGKYLRNAKDSPIALFWGEGIKELFCETVEISLRSSDIRVAYEEVVCDNQITEVLASSFAIPQSVKAIVAVGGGKVIDYCKYIAFISHLPIVTIPTSISNDGFCSPLSSLYVKGRRRSLKTKIPNGVIVDTEIIRHAPDRFIFSGVGDIISNITAIRDWKMAFYEQGLSVNDFAVLVASNAVQNVLSHTSADVDDSGFLGVLSGALVMSGVAMEIAQSSRPSSGSDHLISHAYDLLADPPSLHGIQVGVATYCVSWLQENRHQEIKDFLARCGFFAYVEKNPLVRETFLEAITMTPDIKQDFYSILSEQKNRKKLQGFVRTDPLCQTLFC